jgi:hypothetical protein
VPEFSPCKLTTCASLKLRIPEAPREKILPIWGKDVLGLVTFSVTWDPISSNLRNLCICARASYGRKRASCRWHASCSP